MKTVLFILLAVMETSETNFPFTNQASVLGTSIEIMIKNKKGENLLGTSKFPIADIFVKYHGNDVQPATNSATILDNPNNILFIDQNESKYVKVFLNFSTSEEYPLTFIHWNKTDIDTIKAKYKKSENSLTLEKLWILKNNSWQEIKSKPLIIIK